MLKYICLYCGSENIELVSKGVWKCKNCDKFLDDDEVIEE